MTMVDVKLIGRWSHDINLGHIRKWLYRDMQTLIDNGCRVSQTEHIFAPIELLEGTVPFGADADGKPNLVLNEVLKIMFVEGKDTLNELGIVLPAMIEKIRRDSENQEIVI